METLNVFLKVRLQSTNQRMTSARKDVEEREA